MISAYPSTISRRSLKSNALWQIAGNGIYVLSQGAYLVALARLASPEEVGTFAYAIALSAPIALLSQLSLRHMQAVDVDGTHPFAAYLKLRVIGAILAVILTAAIAFAISTRFDIFVVTILMASAKFGESLSDVCHGYFEQHQNVRTAAISLIVRGSLSVLALAGVYSLTEDLAWSVGALAVTWIGMALLYDLPAVARTHTKAALLSSYIAIRPSAPSSEMLTMARQSLPLGLAAFLTSLHLNAPRYVIEHIVSTDALGIFAAQSSVVVAATVIVHSFNRVLTPEMSRTVATSGRIRPLVMRVAAVSLTLASFWLILAFLVGQQLLLIAFGQPYATQYATFGVLAIAGALTMVSSTFNHALLAIGRHYYRAAVQALAIVAALTSSYWLAARLGLIGAALGYAMSIFLRLVLEVLLFARYTNTSHMARR